MVPLDLVSVLSHLISSTKMGYFVSCSAPSKPFNIPASTFFFSFHPSYQSGDSVFPLSPCFFKPYGAIFTLALSPFPPSRQLDFPDTTLPLRLSFFPVSPPPPPPLPFGPFHCISHTCPPKNPPLYPERFSPVLTRVVCLYKAVLFFR